MMALVSVNPLPAREALSVPGVFRLSHHRARLPQQIRRVPIFFPVLIRVVAGIKRVYQGAAGDVACDLAVGQIVALAPRSEVHLMNIPAGQGYLAEVLGISARSLELFRERHSSVVSDLLARPVSPVLAIEPGDALASAWNHLLALWQHGGQPQTEIARHRLEEVLLSLALQGAGQAIFLARQDAWTERVRLMLQSAPGHKWTAAEAAAKLHCSEATLRRHLASEGSGLRELLDAVRMNVGLNLLLGSSRQVDDIAQACGYESASRFAIRFRQRFGQSPSEMRATR